MRDPLLWLWACGVCDAHRLLPRSLCRLAVHSDFDLVKIIGEGVYGAVYKARHRVTGQLVAVKLIKLHNERQDGVRVCVCVAL